MNFYELYNLLNENTVTQEVKRLFDEKKWLNTLEKVIETIIKSIERDEYDFLNDNSKRIIAKWMLYDLGIKQNSNKIKYSLGTFLVKDFISANTDANGNLNPQLASKFNNIHFKAEDLIALDQQYHENLKKKQRNKPGEIGKNILSFPDGYSWVDLEKSYCDKESESMGHCGNRGGPRSDTILSLRDKQNIPHLTFILNNGNLGEMKGRANEKPATKYHKYIIELLKLPIIKNVKGGGYKPENNFCLTDLKQEELDELLRSKPNFENNLLLNSFSNLSLDSDVNSFPTQIKNELSLILKYTNERFSKLRHIDEIFTEDELIEILNNEKINNLQKTYKSRIGETLDILVDIAFETKREKVQKLVLNKCMEDHQRRVIEGLLANENISNNVLKQIPELLEKIFKNSNHLNWTSSLLSDKRMPEKVLRMVVNSERYFDFDIKLPPGAAANELETEQSTRLYYVAKNPNTPSDLLDILSKDKDGRVIEAVIHNKNTKIQNLKNILKNLEAVPPVYNWRPSLAKVIHDQINDVLKRIGTKFDLRR